MRWQAQYTQVYSDDIETTTTAPTVGPAFSVGPAGSLTSNAAEVIAGNESIKGSYSGSGSSFPFLQTNSSVLPLAPNHPYTVTFQYKILTAPSNFFVVQFLSFIAASQSNFLSGAIMNGVAGTTGTITLTSTLGNYSDYVVFWNGPTTGAISIDNIQIIDATTGKVIASENAEGTSQAPKPGIQSQGATVVTDPSLVISGKGSLLLNNQGGFVTNPSVISIGANTVYTIQFDYRILSPTTSSQVFNASFQPAGSADPQQQVTIPGMLKNAAARGRFSSGAQTAGASSYVLRLSVAPGASLIVDNIVIYRQDVTTQNAPPPTWSRLLTTPFPRLGKDLEIRTDLTASLAFNEGTPFTYSVEQIESRLAFSDVIVGLDLQNQTQNPDSVHRIRALNPNAVILTQESLANQDKQMSPSGATIDLDYQLLQSTPNEWKINDTAGNVVYDRNYPGRAFMNLSDFVPAVNSQTWRTALPNFITTQILPSGLWDGVYFLGAEGVVDPAVPQFDDPALFNYDWNRNGLRDETPAATSEMVRAGKMKILQNLQSSTNGTQLMMGNTSQPEFALATLLNGYRLECFNFWWSQPGAPTISGSPAGWRTAFEAYLRMQAAERSPQTNILGGCGASAADNNTPPSASQHYLTPTPDDIAKHRFTMGTALLGNGFYGYDLKDPLSAPYWFDEYSVDSTGTAVEDRTKKGYLGQPLYDSIELTNPGMLVMEEGFDGGTLPSTFVGGPASAVSITQTTGEVISGAGSLVISNPDHTKKGFVGVGTNPAAVPLSAGVTYLLTFDWRVLETLDFDLGFQVFVSSGSQILDRVYAPGVVTGDYGTTRFPFTIPSTGNWTINILILNGGGKVSIDNFKIYQGGVGPWRRDFENGFVLVNPFARPRTFSAAELAGALNRTSIHRILGTQAPDLNNGQPVAGELTLGPFDAIILLADPIRLRTPIINSVANAAGGQTGVASGAFVSIYGSNFTPLPYDDWGKSIINGQLPKQLDGVSVTIGGKPASVYAVSPGQINVQAPDVGNGPAQVVVTTGGGASAPFTTISQLYSPAFFPWPGNQPVATHLDYSIAAKNGTFSGLTTVPAKPGDVITLWGTGFGPTNPSVPAGQEPTVAGPPTQNPVTVTLGGTAVPVLGAVLSSYAAVYQIAIQIPASMSDGDYPIVATVSGAQSPASSFLTVQRTQ